MPPRALERIDGALPFAFFFSRSLRFRVSGHNVLVAIRICCLLRKLRGGFQGFPAFATPAEPLPKFFSLRHGISHWALSY